MSDRQRTGIVKREALRLQRQHQQGLVAGGTGARLPGGSTGIGREGQADAARAGPGPAR